MEDLEIKDLNIPDAVIRSSPEARVGEEVPLQYLESRDKEGKLMDNLNQGTAVGIYHDGSIASVFRIECPDTYYLAPDKLEAILNGLEAILSTQSQKHNLHFFWNTSDQDNETLELFLEQNMIPGQHSSQKMLRELQAERERLRLLKGELKAYRCYVMISTPYPKKAKKVQNKQEGRMGIPALIKSSMETVLEDLLNLGSLLQRPGEFQAEEKTLLQSIQENARRTELLRESFDGIPGMTTYDVKAGEFFSLYRRSWSPSTWENVKFSGEPLNTTPKRPLRTGLANHYITDTITDHGSYWETDGIHHTLLVMRKPPTFTDIGIILEHVTVQKGKEIHQLEYSLIMVPTDGRKETAILGRNLRLYTKQYQTEPSKYPNHPQIIQSISSQLEKLYNNEGTPGYDVSVIFHLWNKDKKVLDSWKNIIQQNMARPPFAARFAEEQYHALPYYANKMQPGYTNDGDDSRSVHLLAREAATFIPLLSFGSSFLQEEPEGRRVIGLFETDLGNLHPFDWFARGRVSNFGGVGVGTSGSGKSYFYNRVIAGTCSDMDNVIVIDGAVAAGSYRNNAMILSGAGSYIEVGGKSNYCINILETEEINGKMRPPSEDEIQRMAMNIEPMIREERNRPLNNHDRMMLTKAIRMAFDAPTDPEKGKVYLRDVAHSLKNNFGGRGGSQEDRAQRLGITLEDGWCHPHGTYRAFFDGESSPLPEGLVVFDNNGIKDDPVLSSVMVAAQFSYIDKVVQNNLKRGEKDKKRIHVYIDEAWKALNDPSTVEFIVSMYRAGRARNLSPHLITQKMEDLKKLLMVSDPNSGKSELDPNSNAILGNCSWFNLFKHDPSDALVSQNVLGLTEKQTDAVRNLGGVPNQYREMIQFVRMTNGNAFSKLRYRPVDLEYPLFTSDSQDIAVLRGITSRLAENLGWDNPSNQAVSRRETLARLSDVGFKNLETNSNPQLMALLASWEFTLERQRRKQ